MRKIKLPIANTFRSSLLNVHEVSDRLSRGEEKVHFETPDVGKGAEVLEIARDNGAQVVYATVNVENKLDEILTLYFFGTDQGLNERKSIFVNQVLQSSRFDYAFKKDLIVFLVNKLELLRGKDKQKLENGLGNIMKWRNAFAHGKLHCNHLQVIQLEYFYRGHKKNDLLNNNYWDEVEKCFNDTISLLAQSEQKLKENFL